MSCAVFPAPGIEIRWPRSAAETVSDYTTRSAVTDFTPVQIVQKSVGNYIQSDKVFSEDLFLLTLSLPIVNIIV